MAKEKWMVTAKRADFNAIASRFGIDPVTARLIRNRDIVGDEAIELYLHGTLADLHDPMELPDMDKAVPILKKKIEEGKPIRVVGDYDIDGIMASYILKRGLTELGGKADIRIPDRIRDGYGINDHIVRDAAADGIDTIVTVDNGISAGPQMALARELGMTTIVTDHHEVLEMPEADAVIDCKRPDSTYPYREMCGAAVAWKLVKALGGDPKDDLLEYAAFATIGDIVDLTGENRIIVKEGLKRLRKTKNPGLKALARACRTPIYSVDTYHIGFILGPCLNASGRLNTAMRALALLEETDPTEAAGIAQELKDLNDSRKAMTEIGVKDAVAAVEEEGLAGDKILVIYLPDLHESLAGIVAGRIREKYHHPCFVLTESEDGVKGSGRSTENYPMFDALTEVAHLLTRFGGHAMAAGLTLPRENVDAFRREINALCPLENDDFREKILIDVPMPVSYVSDRLMEELKLLEPYGKGNPKPLFAEKSLFFEHPRIFGASRNVLKARVRSMATSGDAHPERLGFQANVRGIAMDAVYFGDAETFERRIKAKPEVMVAYCPAYNDFNGIRRIQIVISHFN